MGTQVIEKQAIVASLQRSVKRSSLAIRLHGESNRSRMRPQHPLRSEPSAQARANHDETAPCSCGFTMASGPAPAYNEEAFRYFLNIESKRAERSGRPLLLVLVDRKGLRGAARRFDLPSAHRLFAALSLGLRETDFVGWYQEHRVAGAVLMQRADVGGPDVSAQVRRRVARIVAQGLPPALAGHLQVRVFQLPSKTKGPR
jgi:hypothetical protein